MVLRRLGLASQEGTSDSLQRQALWEGFLEEVVSPALLLWTSCPVVMDFLSCCSHSAHLGLCCRLRQLWCGPRLWRGPAGGSSSPETLGSSRCRLPSVWGHAGFATGARGSSGRKDGQSTHEVWVLLPPSPPTLPPMRLRPLYVSPLLIPPVTHKTHCPPHAQSPGASCPPRSFRMRPRLLPETPPVHLFRSLGCRPWDICPQGTVGSPFGQGERTRLRPPVIDLHPAEGSWVPPHRARVSPVWDSVGRGVSLGQGLHPWSELASRTDALRDRPLFSSVLMTHLPF